MPKIVILGAGLTGLSLAYHLEKQGFFDYQIFEKDSRPGGLLKTVQQDGFTFDHTGHFLHISNNDFKNFLEEVIGLDTMNILSRRSFIYSNKVYTPYPFQKNLYGLPADLISECITGFVNRKKNIGKPKNFYEWVWKHFGLGLGKHFFFPYNSKLMCIKPKDLMPSWTSRFVPDTSLKALLEGSLERKEYNLSGYNGCFFYPKKGGIEQLIKSILAKLKNKVLTGYKANTIDQNKKIVSFSNGSKAQYQMLFSTMPMPHLLKSFEKEKTSSTLSRAAQKLSCNQVINFNLGINRPELSTKHWVYFPEKKFHIYRMGFWHNFSKNMAPDGTSSVYGEISVKPNSGEKLKKSLENKAIQQVLNFFKVDKSELTVKQTNFLDHAYVTYDGWREKNLKKLHKRLNEKSIYSIGRFGEWKYSSMQEAVLEGIENSHLALKNCLR